jgi:hypothetical protein
MRLRLARHPSRLSAPQPIVIQDMLDLVTSGYTEALSEIIDMLDELCASGHGSPYVRKLQGIPFSELKSTTRRGQRGGARVYFWFLANGDAAIVNCEAKHPDAPTSTAKLKQCLAVYNAYQAGVDVFAQPT